MSTFTLANNLQELTRKRKRGSDINQSKNSPVFVDTCFTNAAYSSTPKQLIGRRRKNYSLKENTNTYMQFPCLEVKSIADLVEEKQKQLEKQIPKNPYEVVRKPPKKKKRETVMEEACFENPALNLELPEKQFNPYEVLRDTTQNATKSPEQHKCFINKALNLRGSDTPASRNPFEIYRCNAAPGVAANPKGVENLGMIDAIPTNLKISLPFTPTVQCRIDFKNLPLSELTPSKLLAEKLVFSPAVIPKRSLSAISEESSMDIGKELDQYQLELENSINEAKLRKQFAERDNDNNKCNMNLVNNSTKQVKQFDTEKKLTFTQKLEEIVEDEGELIEVNIAKPFETCNESTVEAEIVRSDQSHSQTNSTNLLVSNSRSTSDIVYASESESDSDGDFNAPARFVRAYRRANPPTVAVKNEPVDLNNSNHSTNNVNNSIEKTSTVKNLIRKSIRKLIHSKNRNINNFEKPIEENQRNNIQDNNYNTCKNGFMSSIRQSLRHKPKNIIPKEEEEEVPLTVPNISIIDTSERIIKLKSNFMKNELVKEKDLTNEKKQTMRNSIRRSTRGLRLQVMKSVFHKQQEEYNFPKSIS